MMPSIKATRLQAEHRRATLFPRREIIDQENGVDDLHSVRNMSGFNVGKEAQRNNVGIFYQ